MLEVTRWQVFWCDPNAGWTDFLSDPLLAGLQSLSEFLRSSDDRAGQPFLLRSDGMYATGVNEFLGSARMRAAAEGTRRKDALGVNTMVMAGQRPGPPA